MRHFSRIANGFCIACTLAPLAASGQSGDILDGSPPTWIYVETTYDENDEREQCNWYASSADFLASLHAYDADCVIDIRLRGTLNLEGARNFTRLVARLENTSLRPAAIVLDSRGGDADAALAIARSIRGSAFFRRVADGVATRLDGADTAVCFSACIVVFAAGYRRSAEFNIYGDPDLPSRLGIHGPGQFDRTASRYDTSPGNLEIMRVRRAFKEYFEHVGVDPQLVDDMFAVPFDEIRLLTEDDVRRYGLIADQD